MFLQEHCGKLADIAGNLFSCNNFQPVSISQQVIACALTLATFASLKSPSSSAHFQLPWSKLAIIAVLAVPT
jgi:hypothetical protein